MKTLADVQAYLATIPSDASEARRWQAVRTATRRLMKAHGVPDVASWTVTALPPQAYHRFGDCHWSRRTIRYSRKFVREWWVSDLAHTIVHEVAHAVTSAEMVRQHKPVRGAGGHGPMWRGTAAAMGLREAQAHNLPNART